ncbi:helix-turn-helix domain-containing protein [Eubacterium sp.]|uniref:helix-turn-helix domain-containing protein n=1 Tax=Eubacterium sp. TaxID=142586 RepID=UPI0026DED30F|nr:helix-turn-helix transcriptional regulator [Eubacterium sp.]MDO5432997.1 helix-turn-helix transcriptional regulator [Eubacterium sp.]
MDNLLNQRVLTVRKHSKLTQSEFGKRIGISNTAVSKIEKCENNVSEQNIIAICREFNINEIWLRTGEGDMEIKRTEDEELAAFCGKLCAGTDPAIANALLYYSRLSDEDKEFVRTLMWNLGNFEKK